MLIKVFIYCYSQILYFITRLCPQQKYDLLLDFHPEQYMYIVRVGTIGKGPSSMLNRHDLHSAIGKGRSSMLYRHHPHSAIGKGLSSMLYKHDPYSAIGKGPYS